MMLLVEKREPNNPVSHFAMGMQWEFYNFALFFDSMLTVVVVKSSGSSRSLDSPGTHKRVAALAAIVGSL